MGEFLNSIFHAFCEEGQKRKIRVIVGSLFALVIGVIVFEAYTGRFRLQRLTNTAQLLAAVVELETKSGASSPDTQAAIKVLANQALEAAESSQAVIGFSKGRITWSIDILWKFLMASCLCILSVGFEARRYWKQNRRGLLGAAFFIVVTGLTGASLPMIWWPWFHLFIVPLCVLAGFFVVAVPIVAIATGVQKASAKTEAIKCGNTLKNVWLEVQKGEINGTPIQAGIVVERIRAGGGTPCSSSWRECGEHGSEGDPSKPLIRCGKHGHVLKKDGSVA